MKLSLILENTDIQKVLSKLDPKRIEFMCGDRMSLREPRSQDDPSADMNRTTDLVKILQACDPTPTKKWVVGTDFMKKPWISAQFNDGKIAIDGFNKMPGDTPQIKLPEDTATLVELIKFFNDPGKRAQLKKYFPGIPTDIQNHDIRSALSASQNLMDKLRNMKATAFNPVVTAGAVKMIDHDGFEVYMYPRLDLAKHFGLDPEEVVTSLQEAGMGSKWCTRTDWDSGNSRAKPYLTKDTIYTMFKNKVAVYQTVVKGSEEQFMNRAGEEVGGSVDDSINQMFLAAMEAARKMILNKYSYNPPSGATPEEALGFIKNYQEAQAENIAGIIKFGGVEQVTNNPELRKQIINSLNIGRNPKFISDAVKPLIDKAKDEVKARLEAAGLDFNTASLQQTLQVLGLSELYLADAGEASGYGIEENSNSYLSESTRDIIILFVRKPTIYGSVIYHSGGHIILGKIATKELFLGLRKQKVERKTFPQPMVQFLCSGADAGDIVRDPRVIPTICSQVSPLVTFIRYNKFAANMVEFVPQEVWHEIATAVEEYGPNRGELKYAVVIKKLQDLGINMPTDDARDA